MKTLITILLVVLTFVFIEISMAQSVVQLPSPLVISPVAAAPASGGFISFVKSNLAVISGALYFLIDLVILLSPSLAANGLLHQVQLWLSKESGQVPPASS